MDSIEVDGSYIEHLRRTRLCMTRRDAALYMGIHENSLYYIERGRRGGHRASFATLRKIASALECSPEELTAGRTRHPDT